MENNKKIFRPKRLREWLMYALLYQSKKIHRQGRNFRRKMIGIFKQHIKEGLEKYGN